MLKSHDIRSLESRWKEARLGTMFKVIHTQLIALPPARFLAPAKARRQLKKPKHLNDYVADVLSIDKLLYNHTNCFAVPSSKTDQYKSYHYIYIDQSCCLELQNNLYGCREIHFFVQTVLDWNHLDKCVAGSVTYEVLAGLPAFVGRFMYEKEKEKKNFCLTFA
jgi:hypothetical protein